MAMSLEETKTKAAKKKAPMAHSRPGTPSHQDEALGGMAKKMEQPAHVGAYPNVSDPEETLGGIAKKRVSSNGGGNN
jgi:hypothetical protein